MRVADKNLHCMDCFGENLSELPPSNNSIMQYAFSVFSVAKVPKCIPENGFMFDRSPALSTAQVFQWENLSTLFDPSEFQSPQVQ